MGDAGRVAVFGATGHTGAMVTAELIRRGLEPVAGGRDAEALERALRDLPATRTEPVEVRQATVDDADSLRRLAAGCEALISCAGPFSATAAAVAGAAVAAGAHYVDVTAEPAVVRGLFDELDAPARAAGVAVVPAMGFYGAVGDMLAHLAARDLDDLDDVVVAYAVDGWELTAASRRTVPEVAGQRLVGANGSVQPHEGPPSTFDFDVAPPRGPAPVVAPYPSPDPITITRHVRARRIRSAMTASTLHAVADAMSRPADERRDRSRFEVVARASAGGHTASASARGGDIYGHPSDAKSILRLADRWRPYRVRLTR